MDLSDRRIRRVVIVALVLGLVVGLAVDIAGGAPWVLAATALCAVVVAAGQRLPWTMSAALGTMLLLAGYSLVVRLVQPLPGDLATKNRVVLAAVVIVVVVVLAVSRRPLRLPARRPAIGFGAAVLPATAVVLAAVVGVALSGGARVAWSMQNDAVWNTMMSRFLWADGGLGPEHPNVSPLIPALLAGSYAPGRLSVASGDLLLHDVTRQSELWLLLVLTTCILAAAVAWRSLRSLGPRGRSASALAVSAIPALPYVAGYSFQFGFFNATVVLIALLACWLFWLEVAEHRLAAIGGLSAGSVVLLATWAPLAIVPLALGALVLVTAPRPWWAGVRGSRLVVLVGSLGVLPAYVLGITLPDVLREGGALGADGAIMAIQPYHVALVYAVALAVAFAQRRATGSGTTVVGVVVILLSSGVALGYLVSRRLGEASLWGYYPAKLAWLIAAFLLVLIAIGGVALAVRAGRGRTRALLVAATAVVVIGLTLVPRPTSGSLASLASAVLPVPLVVSTEAAHELFAHSDPEETLTVVSRDVTPTEDAFINNWLIQQSADGGLDPIRLFGYLLDASDPAQLCSLAAEAGDALVVVTRDPALAAEVGSACPSGGVSVVVR
ncbi:hypothetical protein [Antiquaquibacter soli]|uniref:Glycosyltransferase RgtA/B/C/D-like domain-containing protein n=1 Tax=Antiquaquibacter soli TaxID=3064523 RepID=A0ABT9BJC9_9MICO|nr:hypothetical protein [Protaetiibacter sp. WY-16]MDO7881130.1 hypothetical protein [Protaetiibacter sp. WY-16]